VTGSGADGHDGRGMIMTATAASNFPLGGWGRCSINTLSFYSNADKTSHHCALCDNSLLLWYIKFGLLLLLQVLHSLLSGMTFLA
jgi:hypothetical protein